MTKLRTALFLACFGSLIATPVAWSEPLASAPVGAYSCSLVRHAAYRPQMSVPCCGQRFACAHFLSTTRLIQPRHRWST